MARHADVIELYLSGPPMTRHEPLLGRRGPYPHPKTTYGIAAWQAEWLAAGRQRVAAPIVLDLYIRVERPPSHFTVSGGLTAAGNRHAYPPRFDVSNALKLVEDALKGLAFGDDSEICAIHASKQWVTASDERPAGTYLSLRTARPST